MPDLTSLLTAALAYADRRQWLHLPATRTAQHDQAAIVDLAGPAVGVAG